jgi:hypothetical protein
LLEAEEPISTKTAIWHFIFTLGAEFESIQNNYRIGNLPAEWNTQDLPTLLVLCHNYSNSVNSQVLLKHESPTKTPAPNGDQAHHHKKVRQWFLNPGNIKLNWKLNKRKTQGSVSIICLTLMLLRSVTSRRSVTGSLLKGLLQLPINHLSHLVN